MRVLFPRCVGKCDHWSRCWCVRCGSEIGIYHVDTRWPAPEEGVFIYSGLLHSAKISFSLLMSLFLVYLKCSNDCKIARIESTFQILSLTRYYILSVQSPHHDDIPCDNVSERSSSHVPMSPVTPTHQSQASIGHNYTPTPGDRTT